MANSCDTNQTVWDLTNATDFSSLVLTSWEYIFYQTSWSSITLLGICTNVSFILTVMKTPSLHTSTYRYLVNLAISDLLFLIINYIPRMVNYHQSPLKRGIPIIVITLSDLLVVCSLGTVTLVSLERFLAICHPIKHHLIKGTRRTNKLIFSVWCISLFYALPSLFVWKTSNICIIWPDDSAFADYPNQHTYLQNDSWTFDLTQSTYFVLCFFLMVFNSVLYIKIYFALKRRNNTDIKLNSSLDLQHRQVANMLIVNSVFFFLCLSFNTSTILVLFIYNCLNDDYDRSFIFVWSILGDILFGLNACMNPVLYLITNKRYRHVFLEVMTWSRKSSHLKTETNVIELPNINII